MDNATANNLRRSILYHKQLRDQPRTPAQQLAMSTLPEALPHPELLNEAVTQLRNGVPVTTALRTLAGPLRNMDQFSIYSELQEIRAKAQSDALRRGW
jgi:hypothetical protein